MSWWRKHTRRTDDPACTLMERYCAGDADAFRALYALLAPLVLAHLAERGFEGASAERTLESAFLTLHHSRSAYVLGADPRPWILAIARHEAARVKQEALRPSPQPQAVSV
jgi:RNA polymerase sigma-70 factor (ECF subfamily)